MSRRFAFMSDVRSSVPASQRGILGGHYSVFIMFRHVALHDLFHAYRIEVLETGMDGRVAGVFRACVIGIDAACAF